MSLIYVPSEGLRGAKIALVGEAPGATEERLRRPFVGKSGQLLRKQFEGCPTLLITNVVKVRPPLNRTPTTEEIKSWSIELFREVSGSKLRIAVGRTAEKALKHLGLDYEYIWHPAYILRNPSKKEEWEERIKECKAVLNLK
jgi:DNA polymerase